MKNVLKSKVYFVCLKYAEGEALTNRMLSLAKGLGELDIKIEICFLINDLPDSGILSGYKNVTFTSLAEKQPHWVNRIKRISFLFSLFICLKMFKKKDIVFLSEFILPLFIIFSYKKLSLYHERSEYPDLFFKNNIFDNILKKTYIARCKKTAGIFVISEKIKKYFIENNIDENKIFTLNMTIDTTRFDGVNKVYTSEEYIAYCGTITTQKDGVDILIKAFNLVTKNYPELKLYLIGNFAYETDKNQILELINRYDLDKKVVFTGKIKASQMPQYLTNAKLLVLSRPQNIQSDAGFPTKLGEYLMTGNPVVITKIGELDKFLTHNKNCIFASPNDEFDFADKIMWVFENPEKSNDIALEGKKMALNEFSYITQARKIKKAIYG